MPVEGLRAWIGEVERKLVVRTRVFLALTAIAVGGAGAGVYLAVDAQDNAVSESDVQALQEQLEGQIDQVSAEAGAGAAPDVAKLEIELKTLQAQVKALQQGKGQGGAKREATK